MLVALEAAFILGTLLSFVVFALNDTGTGGRRCYHLTFPTVLACAVGGLTGLIACCLPGVAMPTAALVAVLVGYLTLRAGSEGLGGRPRVFRSDEVVVVPAHWRDDLV